MINAYLRYEYRIISLNSYVGTSDPKSFPSLARSGTPMEIWYIQVVSLLCCFELRKGKPIPNFLLHLHCAVLTFPEFSMFAYFDSLSH